MNQGKMMILFPIIANHSSPLIPVSTPHEQNKKNSTLTRGYRINWLP